MTNTEEVRTSIPLADDDPRTLFGRAVAAGSSVIAAVHPGQLDDPTPCEAFDVRQLIGHLVGVLERVATIGRGEDPFGPQPELEVGDDAWLAAWTDAAHRVQAAWSDDAKLGQVVDLPWSHLSAGETLTSTYLSEVTLHTWDLATATSQQPAWDAHVVSVALDGLKKILPADRAEVFAQAREAMPPEMRDFEDPYGPVVEVGHDAPLIEQLVAWSGRRP